MSSYLHLQRVYSYSYVQGEDPQITQAQERHGGEVETPNRRRPKHSQHKRHLRSSISSSEPPLSGNKVSQHICYYLHEMMRDDSNRRPLRSRSDVAEASYTPARGLNLISLQRLSRYHLSDVDQGWS